MSTITKLLADCGTHGIRLILAGDNVLDIEAPEDALTTDLLERLKANKVALLEILATKDLSANSQPCPICGSGVMWRLHEGRVACECTVTIPSGAVKVVHTRLSDGDEWELHPRNHTKQLDARDCVHLIDPGTLDADGWPKDSFPWPAPGDPWEQEATTTEAEIVQGACDNCGCTQHHDVPIHDGQSTRRDCAQCGRTHGFPVWHGQKREVNW
jgi:ribosomal protein S27AE